MTGTGRDSRGNGSAYLVACLLAMLTLALPIASASADPSLFETREYSKDFQVPAAQAEDALETQAAGAEADVAGDLEAHLGARYAGLWFDNRSGEFVVPVLGAKSAEAADAELADAGLAGGDYRTVPSQSSWEDLEAAQEQLNQALAQPMSEGLIQTSIDPRTNSVVIRQAEGLGAAAAREVQDQVRSTGVGVEVREEGMDRFSPIPASCGLGGTLSYNCDAPLRGGVGLGKHGQAASCSVGFKATGISTGNRYVLSAGHCAINPTVSEWDAYDHTSTGQYLGVTESAYGGTSGHDLVKIRANGSKFWDISPWPTQVIEWNPETFTVTNSERSITSESSSYVGEYACLTGITTGTSCGTVTAMNETVSGVFQGLPVIVNHLSKLSSVCNQVGNSGGPVFAGNIALGMTSFADGELPECKNYDLYTEITEDTNYLGVTVAPRSTQTVIDSATALNGNPGWATVKGHINAAGVSALNGAKVNIKLFKWEGSSWVLKATPQATVGSGNGSFELKNWNGVGPGSWIAKAIFPGQTPFVASESNEAKEGAFEVKDGYQLVNKYSGKCLDVEASGQNNGVNMEQWECGNPATSVNQVFTLVPQGGDYYQIVARHSNRCADVVNESPNNGAWIQQWDCSGSTNQSWLGKPGAPGYSTFVNKKSGKCLEIGGPTTANGAKAQQWDCLGESQANQQWSFKSVEAGPVATKTTEIVTQTLNGEPGWVTVEGEVQAGAYSLNGQTVNFFFYKKNTAGEYVYTTSTSTTINNNTHFSLANFGVGVGEWKVRAEFPLQGKFARSNSGEPTFTINKGYRLVNVYSGKCLDVENWGTTNGVNMDQWDCLGPISSHLNQVFTLVPLGSGDYRIVAKNSGRCADVINESFSNGAWIQQWDCLGSTNQTWHGEPMGGYTEFINKHSGRCLEIGGPSQNNGAKAQQWDCLGASQTNQLWSIQSVTW